MGKVKDPKIVIATDGWGEVSAFVDVGKTLLAKLKVEIKRDRELYGDSSGDSAFVYSGTLGTDLKFVEEF